MLTGLIDPGSLIPHSGTMCLVERIVSWDDRHIACATRSHRNADNPLRRDRRLHAVHGIEYGAQAMAIHGGLRWRRAGRRLPPGFLAALHDVRLYIDYLDTVESDLAIQAERLFGETGTLVYQFEVRGAGTLLVTARATVIEQPGASGP